MDGDVVAAILGGSLLGGLVGALTALVTAKRQLSFETRQWRQDALVRGMGFLTGGRQERSVGIGLIESLIVSGNIPPEIRHAVDTVLWNQLRYVIYQGEPWLKHENLNAHRLIELVEESPTRSTLPKYSTAAMDDIRRLVDEPASSLRSMRNAD
jgi:hypothetical protein